MIRRIISALLAIVLVTLCLFTLAETRSSAEIGFPEIELTSVPMIGGTEPVEGKVFLAGLEPEDCVIIAIVDGIWPKPYFDSYLNPLIASEDGDYATFSFSVTTGGKDTSFNTFTLYLCRAAMFEDVSASSVTDSFMEGKYIRKMEVDKTEFNTRVEQSQPTPAPTVDFYSFPVYDDALVHYGDIAYMGSQNNGDDGSMKIDSSYTKNPHSGDNCIQITYTPPSSSHWAGMMWLSGANNFSPNPPVDGVDTAQASQLVFYARGSGSTKIFIENDERQQVTLKVRLTRDWKQYTLAVPSDWEQICVGFGFASSGSAGKSVIYLDDIAYMN